MECSISDAAHALTLLMHSKKNKNLLVNLFNFPFYGALTGLRSFCIPPPRAMPWSMLIRPVGAEVQFTCIITLDENISLIAVNFVIRETENVKIFFCFRILVLRFTFHI